MEITVTSGCIHLIFERRLPIRLSVVNDINIYKALHSFQVLKPIMIPHTAMILQTLQFVNHALALDL